MTTEEERKAAHLAIAQLVSPNGSLCYTDAIDLRCALTRTEKRLEVAEGLLRRAADLKKGYTFTDISEANTVSESCIASEAWDIATEADLFLNPPAEGE